MAVPDYGIWDKGYAAALRLEYGVVKLLKMRCAGYEGRGCVAEAGTAFYVPQGILPLIGGPSVAR